MKHTVMVTLDRGDAFHARAGQTLLDAALMAGVDLPHDCRSGHCGTCRCAVVEGAVDGGDEDSGDVLACQARLVSDVTIAVEDTPPVETRAGVVRSVKPIGQDVVEVEIGMRRPLEYLPGQYCQFRFAGFPGRCYSPTAPTTGPVARDALCLHVRRIANGRISSALGTRIGPGHRVKIDGPYGSAYLRAGRSQRLVLVASGTGFAPIWSIALAAIAEMPDREIVAVVGARTREAYYMAPALKRLAAFPRARITPVLQFGQSSDQVPIGSPADYLPPLAPDDIVYAAGAPGMVRAVSEIARTARARCFADPFAPSEPPPDGRGAPNLIARAFRRVLALSPQPTA